MSDKSKKQARFENVKKQTYTGERVAGEVKGGMKRQIVEVVKASSSSN